MTSLPKLPEPDGYAALTPRGTIVVPPQDFAKHNAYAIYTADQLRARDAEVWRCAMDAAAKAARGRAEDVRKSNTYRGKVNQAAQFAADQLEFAADVLLALDHGGSRMGDFSQAMTALAEVLPFADLLERAAFVIRRHADELRLAHTIRGRWPAGEESVRDEFYELAALADRLGKAAAYQRPNPMGGPAVVFDACADSIRAGDPISFAMANYGLKWAKP